MKYLEIAGVFCIRLMGAVESIADSLSQLAATQRQIYRLACVSTTTYCSACPPDDKGNAVNTWLPPGTKKCSKCGASSPLETVLP